ncbi:MAG: hypothetical protein ABL984_15580 [Pyrinomonadaceae bacterium]
MKIVVGYRRLYEALGCKFSSDQAIQHPFSFQDGYGGLIYFGPTPNLGVFTHESTERFLLPGEQNNLGKIEFRNDVNQTKFAGLSFFEVIVTRVHKISKKKYESALNGSSEVRDELLDLCESDRKTFMNLHSMIAGAIGLKIHRQFVMNLLNENQVLIVGDKPFFRFHTKTFENLDAIKINLAGIKRIEELVEIFDKVPQDAFEDAGEVLRWLHRAWSEMDPISKFIACFIPIECILAPVSIPMPPDERSALKKIGKLISKAESTEREELRRVFTKYRQPRFPSLEERFEKFAREVNYKSVEEDINAFRRFNKIRNDLHHRGDASANIVIDLDSSTVHSLEDIMERYVNYAIFADRRIYRSTWRPRFN